RFQNKTGVANASSSGNARPKLPSPCPGERCRSCQAVKRLQVRPQPLSGPRPLSLQLARFHLTSHSLNGEIMADVANKYPENAAGKFYVDEQCIDCDLCRETAPANFKRNDDGGHSYVYKQPESPEEEGLCKEAMEGCPVEAIGNDGA